MADQAQQAIQALSDSDLADLWRKMHSARAMGALAVAEAELIRRARMLAEQAARRASKGGFGSGYHDHEGGIGGPGNPGGSRPRGAAGAGTQGQAGKTQYFGRPTDEKIARWEKEIEGWEGARGGMATSALRTIKQERMAHVVIEDGRELKAIACLSVPRIRRSPFGDRPPTSKIVGIFYAATKERGHGLEMMKGIARKVADEGWQLSFNATDTSIGFYRAIGMTPEREGGKTFFLETEEVAAWLNSLPTN